MMHDYWRNNQVWRADSNEVVKSYIVRDLTDDHIANILANVTHLDKATVANFEHELACRKHGVYPSVAEYK